MTLSLKVETKSTNLSFSEAQLAESCSVCVRDLHQGEVAGVLTVSLGTIL